MAKLRNLLYIRNKSQMATGIAFSYGVMIMGRFIVCFSSNSELIIDGFSISGNLLVWPIEFIMFHEPLLYTICGRLHSGMRQ